MTLLQFDKPPIFILTHLEQFDLTGPPPHHNQTIPIPHIIMLDLIRIDLTQLLPSHRPNINNSISLTTRCHNILLTLRHKYTTCISFIYISSKFLHLSKIYTTLTTFKFVVGDCFVEC